MEVKYLLLLLPTIAMAEVPNVFEPGEVAEAHQVNENFDVLDARIEELRAELVAAQTPAVSTECPCAAEYVTAMQLYIGLGGTLAEGVCYADGPSNTIAPETETTYTTGSLSLTLHAEIHYGSPDDFYACKAELNNPGLLFSKRHSVTQTENLNPWIASCQALVESYCVLP